MFLFYKLIVAGGRDFDDYELLSDKLEKLRIAVWKNDIADDIEIVCGKARGADSLGERWAKENHVSVKEFPANWNRQPDGSYDKSAGHKRNREMGDYGDALLAFWDGKSRGTKNMISYAEEKGLGVFVVRY